MNLTAASVPGLVALPNRRTNLSPRTIVRRRWTNRRIKVDGGVKLIKVSLRRMRTRRPRLVNPVRGLTRGNLKVGIITHWTEFNEFELRR